MTERENFLATLQFADPDWVPTGIPDREIHYHGCHHTSEEGLGHHSPQGTNWTDIWGVGWHKDLEGVMGFPRVHPLADLSRLDDYTFPNPHSEACYGEIYAMKAQLEADGLLAGRLLSGSHRDTLWERAYMLVGMEELMCCFYTDPERVEALFTRIMDFQLAIAQHYVRAGIHMACLSDDMGTQRSLLLGLDLFDRFLLPQYARLIQFYKAHSVLIHFHSCGHVEPLLTRWMDLGVDILNPVQASANNLDTVRSITKGRMTLHGGIDSKLLMEGTPEAIAQCVQERMTRLNACGGYICAPDQGMPFPAENIVAYEQAAQRYGQRRSWNTPQ